MGIVLAILLFGFIVFFHELGHFLLARINAMCMNSGSEWGRHWHTKRSEIQTTV